MSSRKRPPQGSKQEPELSKGGVAKKNKSEPQSSNFQEIDEQSSKQTKPKEVQSLDKGQKTLLSWVNVKPNVKEVKSNSKEHRKPIQKDTHDMAKSSHKDEEYVSQLEEKDLDVVEVKEIKDKDKIQSDDEKIEVDVNDEDCNYSNHSHTQSYDVEYEDADFDTDSDLDNPTEDEAMGAFSGKMQSRTLTKSPKKEKCQGVSNFSPNFDLV